MKDKPTTRVDRVIEEYDTHVWQNILALAIVLEPFKPIEEESFYNPNDNMICLFLWLLSVEPCFFNAIN